MNLKIRFLKKQRNLVGLVICFFQRTREVAFFGKVQEILVRFVFFQESVRNFGWAENLVCPGFGDLGCSIFNYWWLIDTKSHGQRDFSDQNNVFKICISNIFYYTTKWWSKEQGESTKLYCFFWTCNLSNKKATKNIYKTIR